MRAGGCAGKADQIVPLHPAAGSAANTSIVALSLITTADLAAILLPPPVRVICCCTPTAITFGLCWDATPRKFGRISHTARARVAKGGGGGGGRKGVGEGTGTLLSYPCRLLRKRTRIHPASRICCPCTAGSQGMGMNLECQHNHPLCGGRGEEKNTEARDVCFFCQPVFCPIICRAVHVEVCSMRS